MSEPPESYSSKKAGNTRVKVKERKKTVGITLSWDLVKAARKLRINISKIAENAVKEYIRRLEGTSRTTDVNGEGMPTAEGCPGAPPGRVDQLGMIAALASLRPRVQIPPRPP